MARRLKDINQTDSDKIDKFTSELYNFIPKYKYDDHIIKSNCKFYFSVQVCSEHILFLAEENIKKKIKKKGTTKNDMYIYSEHNIFISAKGIISILCDCYNRDNKFRTIDVAAKYGDLVKVIEDKTFTKDLGTPIYYVDDEQSFIKYTNEARFLYTVYKYLEFLKYKTDIKVFLDIDHDKLLAIPQYSQMKPFRFDLYIPCAKLCIEFLEGHHTDQIEDDETRMKFIEYHDIEVLSFDLVQKTTEISSYLTQFLLDLKDKIAKRSIYFADRNLTIDEYVYFFKMENDEIDTDLAKEMLLVRENGHKFNITFKRAIDLIRLSPDRYDEAIQVVIDELTENEHFKCEGDLNFKNIFLNRNGFCDFCLLMKTGQSKKIYRYYRQIEDMCISMIDKRMAYMREQTKKKKDYAEVTFNFLRKIWTFEQDKKIIIAENNKKAYENKVSEEITLNRRRNRKLQTRIDSISSVISSSYSDNKKVKSIKSLIDQAKGINNNEDILEDGDIVIPNFDILVYCDEHSSSSAVTYNELLQKYDNYMSTSPDKKIKENINSYLVKYKNQIKLWSAPSCFGTTSEQVITNVKWKTIEDDELENDEEYNCNEQDKSDNDVSSITKSVDEFELNSDNDIEYESELESELIEDNDSETEDKNLVQKYLKDNNSNYDSDFEQLIDKLPLEDLNISGV